MGNKLMQYYDNYVQHKEPESPTEPAPVSSPSIPAVKNNREYYKLAGVFAVIAVCATVMSVSLGFDWQIWLEWFVGGFLVIFGSFKLISYETFIMAFGNFDPLMRRFPLYKNVYPFLQLFLGFLFVANLAPLLRNVASLAMFSVGTYGIMQYQSKAAETAQFTFLENYIKLPMPMVTMIEDVLMMGLSAIMLISFFVV